MQTVALTTVVLPVYQGVNEDFGEEDHINLAAKLYLLYRDMDIDFMIHTQGHIYRAAQEGIAFAFHYGMNILQEIGDKPTVIRAGEANMFLSPLFCKTLATITGISIELFNTDNSLGAARGAALGAGIYTSLSDCFRNLLKTRRIDPDKTIRVEVTDAYERWLNILQSTTGNQQ